MANKIWLFDLSKTLLFAKDKSYNGGLNNLHRSLVDTADYAFFDHFELNNELLKYLESKKSSTRMAIFTSGYIQEYSDLNNKLDPLFERVFSAAEIGLSKSSPDAYVFIADQLKVDPKEITFIDDVDENVEAARSVGMNGIVYIDNQSLIRQLDLL